MNVAIKATATVTYGMQSEISDDDYTEYKRLLDLYKSEPAHEVDYKLEMWAGSLGLFDGSKYISSIDDFKDIECFLVK